jgi:hypothetical protein
MCGAPTSPFDLASPFAKFILYSSILLYLLVNHPNEYIYKHTDFSDQQVNFYLSYRYPQNDSSSSLTGFFQCNCVKVKHNDLQLFNCSSEPETSLLEFTFLTDQNSGQRSCQDNLFTIWWADSLLNVSGLLDNDVLGKSFNIFGWSDYIVVLSGVHTNGDLFYSTSTTYLHSFTPSLNSSHCRSRISVYYSQLTISELESNVREYVYIAILLMIASFDFFMGVRTVLKIWAQKREEENEIPLIALNLNKII